ncbi:MAG: (Fe-S)-binding protein [Pyrinomonadaceae bacterium]|nr:(Fe-S)-binding protein [Phycisphaerales bacterium]
MRIALFITCLTDTFYPRTGVAVVRVLEHLGHHIEFPQAQTCCGQPMYNNGFTAEARTLALQLARVFEPFDTVVTASGSCAAMVREHSLHLFDPGTLEHSRLAALAAKTYEFSELLRDVLQIELSTLSPSLSETVTYHYACHLRSLGIKSQHEQLLGDIDGLEYRPLENKEQCCGFGGTFAVKYPTISGQMVDDKVQAIRKTGASTVISSDAGCTMNISGACRRAGHEVRFKSLPELLAESLGLMRDGDPA